MSTGTKAPSKSESPSHSSAPARTHNQATSSAGAGTGGLAHIQQPAGNLAIQQLLNAGAIKAKLTISQPNDPDEQEADRVADHIMRMEDPGLISSSAGDIHRKCAACDVGGTRCTNCAEEETIRRKESPEGTSQASTSGHSLFTGLRGGGAPLSPSVRAFFEPRFGRDLSDVRVHTAKEAEESARSIHARAYTINSDIFFATNQYSPESHEGKALLAHELSHVVQRKDTNNPSLRRSPLDPANEVAWSYMAPSFRRSGYMQDTFLETLSAATGASMALEHSVREESVPQSDDEREVFEARMRRLVRLNALGLMASHRATIEFRQREAIRSFENRTEPEGEFDSAVPGREAFINRIRQTGARVHQLQQLQNELEDYRRELGVISAQSITGSYWGSITGVYNDILDNTEPHMSENIRAYLGQTARVVFGQRRSEDELRLYAHVISGYLEEWRRGQVNGVKLALSELYEAYPFFSEVGAENFAEGEYENDDALELAVRNAYLEVLDDIDVAIVNIGSGDTHPFDLPEAVNYTRASLPENLQSAFDEVIGAHELTQFWKTLGWTFAQLALVFIPVVGPALAAGAGLLDLAMQVEETMDQYALSDAATNPEGELLGVSGPGTLDYALLAVTTILTAVDLGMVAREFRTARGAMALDALRLSEGSADELTALIDDLMIDPSDVGRLGTINEETLDMFQRNPSLLSTLSDNPVAARLLKHCSSPCWPENLESWVVEYLDDLMENLSTKGLSLDDIGMSRETLRARLAEVDNDEGYMRIFDELQNRIDRADDSRLGMGSHMAADAIDEPGLIPEYEPGLIPEFDPGYDPNWAPEGRHRFPARNRGEWIEGGPGDGRWQPHDPGAYGLERGQSIPFSEGVPDFRAYAVDTPSGQPGHFQVQGLTGNGRADYQAAVRALAVREGWTIRECQQWLRENNLRLHHFSGNEMQIVTERLHGALGHQGSAVELR